MHFSFRAWPLLPRPVSGRGSQARARQAQQSAVLTGAAQRRWWALVGSLGHRNHECSSRRAIKTIFYRLGPCCKYGERQERPQSGGTSYSPPGKRLTEAPARPRVASSSGALSRVRRRRQGTAEPQLPRASLPWKPSLTPLDFCPSPASNHKNHVKQKLCQQQQLLSTLKPQKVP